MDLSVDWAAVTWTSLSCLAIVAILLFIRGRYFPRAKVSVGRWQGFAVLVIELCALAGIPLFYYLMRTVIGDESGSTLMIMLAVLYYAILGVLWLVLMVRGIWKDF